MEDGIFDYWEVPSQRKSGKQAVFSTFVKELEDYNTLDPLPQHLEWVIEAENPVLFDSLTRFHVEMGILVSTKTPDQPAIPAVVGVGGAEGAAAVAAIPGVWGDYEPCQAAEWSNFRLAPNYFENFFKGWYTYHLNGQPKTHDESNYIPYKLNTLLYWMMDERLKNEICQEPWHPGRAVPTADKKWNFEEGGAWHNYSQHLLTGNTC